MKMNKFIFIGIILLISIIGIEKVSAAACSGAPTSGCTISTSYQMPFNQTYNLNVSGIVAWAGNLIIDCNYSRIYGNGTANSVGIEISQSNVTVKNCIVDNFYQNIKSSSKSGNYFYNNTFGTSRGGNVMWLYKMNDTIIASNTFTNHTNSVIYFFGGTFNNQIYNNTFLDNTSSVNYNIIIMNTSAPLTYSDNFSIHDNYFDSNCYHIYMQGINVSSIYNNTFRNSLTKYGLYTIGLYNSQVFGNVFYNNFYGIYLAYSHDNLVYNNSVDSNGISGSHGVLLSYSDYNNQVYNNFVTGSQFAILHEWNSWNNTYYYNTVTNSSYGLYELHNTQNISFYNNTLSCSAGSFGTIVLEDRVSNGLYSDNILNASLCNASIQLLNNSNGTFSRNYDVRGMTYYNVRDFSGNNLSIINQASRYPYNDIKNTSNNVILYSNINNQSIILSPNQQIEVGDFNISFTYTLTKSTSVPGGFIKLAFTNINDNRFSNITVYLLDEDKNILLSELSLNKSFNVTFSNLVDPTYYIRYVERDLDGNVVTSSDTLNTFLHGSTNLPQTTHNIWILSALVIIAGFMFFILMAMEDLTISVAVLLGILAFLVGWLINIIYTVG